MADAVTLSAYGDEIEELIAIDRTDEAITLCKHILHYYPKHIDTYRLMAEAMFKRGDLEGAQELFRRVLSADPENVVAYARLATIFEKQHQRAEVLWHLERAYELAPTHPEIRTQLLHLYNEIEGEPRERLKLTPGALARLYVQEGLFSQAIQEFRAIGSSEPARYDARVALAELWWRVGRAREAADVAQNLLQWLPYCLKANLILGTLWHESGLQEGETYLERAQALDPMNQIAQALFGARSPLYSRQVLIPRYVPGAAVPVDATPSFDKFFREAATETPPMAEPSPAETSALESNAPSSEEHLESSEPVASDSGLSPWLREGFRATQAESPTSTPTAEPPAAISSTPPAWLTELQKTDSETPESKEEIETPTPGLLSWLEVAKAEEKEAVSGASSDASAETKPARSQEIDRAKEEELSAPVETRADETKQAPTSLSEPRAQPAPAEVSRAIQEETPEMGEPVATEEVSRETPVAQLATAEVSRAAEEQAPEASEPVAIEEASSETPAAQPTPAEVSHTAEEQASETSEPVVIEKASRETPVEELKIPAWVKVLTQRPSAAEQSAGASPPPTEQTPAQSETSREEQGGAIPPQPERKPKRPLRGFDRLVQAREYRDANQLKDALAEYDYVVQHVPYLLKDAIDDLEQLVDREGAPLETHRILGDAYARADRLAEALERYRFVLEHVS